ncbi:MAG: cytidine deaminase [Crocinitomicaceae bacterium]|jgi:cytidine deaminase|nr:cytidine deaminase [Crocinitomicaceae bacterium]MDG2463973.1 cytidine deaminase [Crocinitomicaceae bacterium]
MRKELSIAYDYYNTVQELSKSDQKFIEKAHEAAKTAHAPYSRFHVGAALLMSDGEVILGSNQENIAFPSGLCAERVALFYAGANFPGKSVQKLFVVAKGDLIDKKAILSPCGSCRQVMLESRKRQEIDFQIYLIGQDDSVTVFASIYDLMPFAFGK